MSAIRGGRGVDFGLRSGSSGAGRGVIFRRPLENLDFSENGTLEFVKFELEKPKYDVEECQQRGMTFAAPLKVTLRLIVFDVDEE